MSSSSSNENISSSDLTESTPRKPYRQEHPIFKYRHHQRSRAVQRQSQAAGERADYLMYITKVCSEAGRMGAAVLFQGRQREVECNCAIFQRNRACYHTLSLVDRDAYASRICGGRLDDAIMDLNSPLFAEMDVVNRTVELVSTYPTIAGHPMCHSQCLNCSLVQRAASSNHIPKHTCDIQHKTRYGIATEFRTKLAFPSRSRQTIELDASCRIIHHTQFHLLLPLLSEVEKELNRLDIPQSVIQLCLQDPKFVETMHILIDYKQDVHLGTYFLYLYLEHRLIPYLTSLKKNIVDELLIPVYNVVTTTNPEFVTDVNGLPPSPIQKPDHDSNDIEKEVQQQCVTLEAYYRIEDRTNKDFVSNRLCDLMIQQPNVAAIVLPRLNRTISVLHAVRLFIQQKYTSATWTKHGYIFSDPMFPATQKLCNIFGVIPSATMALPLSPILIPLALMGRYTNHEKWEYHHLNTTKPFRQLYFD